MSLARNRFLAMMALLDAANQPPADNLNLDHGRFMGDWDMTPSTDSQDATLTFSQGCAVVVGNGGLTTVSANNPLTNITGPLHVLIAGTEALDFDPEQGTPQSFTLEWPDISADSTASFMLMLHGATHTPLQAIMRIFTGSGDPIQIAAFNQANSEGTLVGHAATLSGAGSATEHALTTPVSGHQHRVDFHPDTGLLSLVDIHDPENPVTLGTITFPVADLPTGVGLRVSLVLVRPAATTSMPPFTINFSDAGLNTAFRQTAIHSAATPEGAKDGHWLRVTAGGPFDGQTTEVNDFVCLYGNRQKLMILRLPTGNSGVPQIVATAITQALAEGGDIRAAIDAALSVATPPVTFSELGENNPAEGAVIALTTAIEGGFEAFNNARIELSDGVARSELLLRIGIIGSSITDIVPLNTIFAVMFDTTAGDGGSVTSLSLQTGDGALITYPVSIATAKRTRLAFALVPNTSNPDGGRVVLLSKSEE